MDRLEKERELMKKANKAYRLAKKYDVIDQRNDAHPGAAVGSLNREQLC